MYVKRIRAQNVGPLSDLLLEPRINASGNPIPIVIVGQNGSGKSLALSIVIDAITEIRRSVFDKIPEVEGSGCLKLSAKRYIRHAAKYSFAEVLMSSQGGDVFFREVMARANAIEVQTEFPELAEIVTHDQRWIEGGFYKKPVIPEDSKKEVLRENFLYFPYFRYEKAAWIAESAKIDFARENKYHGQAVISPIRTSIIDETRRWILNILLDRELYEKQITTISSEIIGGISLPITLFSGYDGPNTKLFDLINQILLAMLKAKDPTVEVARLGIGNKSNRDISVFAKMHGEQEKTIAPDIGMLSSGELMTIALATEIIRVYEITKGAPPLALDEVTGIVLIDEIDLHLHISFQKLVLPAIIRRFPKVQFIITTHSPFFVLGMQETGETDIIALPIGNKIAPEDFSEFQESYNVFIDKNNQFKTRYDSLSAKVAVDGKPLIITEGKTDWQHIKEALSIAQSGEGYTDLEVEFFEFQDTVAMGDAKLRQMCESIAILPQKRKLIFIFDRDRPEIIRSMSGEPRAFKSHGHQVYSLCLPVPSHRVNYKNISIELYYFDDDLRTIDPVSGKRLWFTNEIEKTVSMTTNKSIMRVRDTPVAEEELYKKVYDNNVEDIKNASGDSVALSKSSFLSQILYNINISGNFDRSAFNQLFDVMRTIMAEPE